MHRHWRYLPYNLQHHRHRHHHHCWNQDVLMGPCGFPCPLPQVSRALKSLTKTIQSRAWLPATYVSGHPFSCPCLITTVPPALVIDWCEMSDEGGSGDQDGYYCGNEASAGDEDKQASGQATP